MRQIIYTGMMTLLLIALATQSALATKPPRTTVPPTLEIEVLDPGVDPLGNPAVVLRHLPDGRVEVDIPPVVLVHRFYYSGDRSFQGPLLPGGPSILVFNHPQTGERCYVPAQMMPGAPRVTYKASGIEYNYGQHALLVHFDKYGCPVLQYRSGPTWREKTNELLHVDEWHDRSKEYSNRMGTTMAGAAADVRDATRVVTLPAQQIMGMLPFGQMISGDALKDRWMQRGAEYQREKELRKAQKEAEMYEQTLPTIR
jgi:hypothetical protein